jgi:hypothetical protein
MLFLLFVALAISMWALSRCAPRKPVTAITRAYEAHGVSKVILRAALARTAIIETDPQAKSVQVSGSASGGAKGYHPMNPFWRETPAEDWGLDFVSERHGDILVISSKNEVRYIHHFYALRDLRIRIPPGIEVICQERELTGEAGPELSPP